MPKEFKFCDRTNDGRIIGPGWIARCKHPDNELEDVLYENFLNRDILPKMPKDFVKTQKYWIRSNRWSDQGLKHWGQAAVYVGRFEPSAEELEESCRQYRLTFPSDLNPRDLDYAGTDNEYMKTQMLPQGVKRILQPGMLAKLKDSASQADNAAMANFVATANRAGNQKDGSQSSAISSKSGKTKLSGIKRSTKENKAEKKKKKGKDLAVKKSFSNRPGPSQLGKGEKPAMPRKMPEVDMATFLSQSPLQISNNQTVPVRDTPTYSVVAEGPPLKKLAACNSVFTEDGFKDILNNVGAFNTRNQLMLASPITDNTALQSASITNSALEISLNSDICDQLHKLVSSNSETVTLNDGPIDTSPDLGSDPNSSVVHATTRNLALSSLKPIAGHSIDPACHSHSVVSVDKQQINILDSIDDEKERLKAEVQNLKKLIAADSNKAWVLDVLDRIDRMESNVCEFVNQLESIGTKLRSVESKLPCVESKLPCVNNQFKVAHWLDACEFTPSNDSSSSCHSP